jgi:hypothetical protein
MVSVMFFQFLFWLVTFGACGSVTTWSKGEAGEKIEFRIKGWLYNPKKEE